MFLRKSEQNLEGRSKTAVIFTVKACVGPSTMVAHTQCHAPTGSIYWYRAAAVPAVPPAPTRTAASASLNLGFVSNSMVKCTSSSAELECWRPERLMWKTSVSVHPQEFHLLPAGAAHAHPLPRHIHLPALLTSGHGAAGCSSHSNVYPNIVNKCLLLKMVSLL